MQIAALGDPDIAIFIGVEQRRSLIEVAEFTANALGVPRVSFVHRNMADIEWTNFDSFYLYNPFYETVEPIGRIDQRIILGREQFALCVSVVQENLKRLRPGTRVVTYNGFGGNFPDSYRRVLKEPHGDDYLELWVKEPLPDEINANNEAVPIMISSGHI